MSTASATDSIALESGWKAALSAELAAPYMVDLLAFLQAEEAAGQRIFPPATERFAALSLTPLEAVRVVILGQDPYHGAGQAHGLCFSVRDGVRLPPSLLNITKELSADLGIPRATSGDLSCWARQGVLLLNAVLTVEEGRAASHAGLGWERFTDAIIATLAARAQPCAFILWGSYAQRKAQFVEDTRHLVLKAPHPSPLSAHRGFFGSKPFSTINAWLERQGEAAIEWAIPAPSTSLFGRLF